MKNTKKSVKIISIILSILIVLFIAVDIFAGNYLMNYAIGRGGDGGNRNVTLDVDGPKSDIERISNANIEMYKHRVEEFKQNATISEYTLTATDGTNLKGYFALNSNPTSRWAITVHGYRNNHESMMKYAQEYYRNGYNVLAPDLRACGNSEGKYVGMGWLDKSDILCWVDWIISNDPNAKIVIHGVSMGAATTMMTSGENTPDNVVAFVEDCGYTSVWDIFSSELKLRFGLPSFPILNTASILSKTNAKYGFKEASALNQIKKCEKPMYFIHGNQDDFIPFSMLKILYDAKPGENKGMLEVDGAGHAKSINVLGDEYWINVFNFLGNYIN